VSFVEIEAEIFLKTIIPSRKLPQTVNWFMSLEDAKNKIERKYWMTSPNSTVKTSWRLWPTLPTANTLCSHSKFNETVTG
jgi:hypothetical protein